MASNTSGTQQKYVVLANRLGAQVQSGVLKPGDRLPSILDLRNLYGVSQATAQRAYSILEREGLVVRRPSSGFFVADWQRMKRQYVLGMSLPAKIHRHPYYERIVRGVQDVLSDEQVELHFFQENAVIRWEKVDGVILTTLSRATYENLPVGMPTVSVLGELRSGMSVVADDKHGLELLVEHLLSLGHRRIAYLAAALVPFRELDIFHPQNGQYRLDGYYNAMRAAGIEPDPAWVRPLRDPYQPMQRHEVLGQVAMTQWLNEDWNQLKCTALIAQNDETAVGIIDTLQSAGIRVPDDVSVVGFDGLDVAEYFRPKLTTIGIPLEEIGAQAARLLLRQIRMPLSALNASDITPREPQTMVLPSILKVGDSSGPCVGP